MYEPSRFGYEESSMTDLSLYQTLRVERDERGVLSVVLNRPDIRNAFNETVIHELRTVFEACAKDPLTRIVVLRGQGPAFCAGGDLNWMRKSVELDYPENLRGTREL